MLCFSELQELKVMNFNIKKDYEKISRELKENKTLVDLQQKKFTEVIQKVSNSTNFTTSLYKEKITCSSLCSNFEMEVSHTFAYECFLNLIIWNGCESFLHKMDQASCYIQ